jgi:phospholipid transport system substrate-binding protein
LHALKDATPAYVTARSDFAQHDPGRGPALALVSFILQDVEQTMPQLNRRFVAAALAAVAVAANWIAAAPSHAQGARDPSAEQFVEKGAQQIISILADKSTSEAQKEAAFRHAIDQLADVPKITNFVLGKYGRSITPEQHARFATAFRAYSERVYRDRLNDYRGETVKVTGSTVRKPGDVIVHTAITGGQLKEPYLVSWRVLGGAGPWRLVDVEFKGVWLAIAQQQDFVSTLDNAHGDIDVLIAKLNELAKHPLPKQQ